MKAKYFNEERKHSEYFEAIIQLRPLNKLLYNWVINDIENSNVKISKEEVTKNGFDIYIDSNQYALSLGKRLRKRYKGKVTLSRQLHSTHKMTSKQLFRVTMLFRLDKEVRDGDEEPVVSLKPINGDFESDKDANHTDEDSEDNEENLSEESDNEE